MESLLAHGIFSNHCALSSQVSHTRGKYLENRGKGKEI